MGKQIELRNGTDLVFTDISSEQLRTYYYPDGSKVCIPEPLYFAKTTSGSHRVLDVHGHSHYVAAGFIHIEWIAWPDQPHFVA